MLLTQDVKIKWNKRTRKWYESKGYIFTNYDDEFEVCVNDLSSGYYKEIWLVCDFCNKPFTRKYNAYLRTQRKSQSKESCCEECKPLKITCTHKNKNKNISRLDIYKKILNNELRAFPDNFFDEITNEEIKDLILYFLEKLKEDEILKENDYLPKIFKQEILLKYKLYSFDKKFSVYNLLEITFPNKYMPWEFNKVPNNYWDNSENVKCAMNWFENKLIERKIIKSKFDFPKINLKKYLKEYNLYKILHSFKSVSNLMNSVYPNYFNVWDFTVPKNYYKNDNNLKYVMEWFVNKLLEDNIIVNIDEIPKKIDSKIFEVYNLNSFFTHCFRRSTYKAFDFIYPNKWKPWEYKMVPMNFWSDGKNIRLAFDWFISKLIEDKVIESIQELPKIPLYTLLKKYGLVTLTDKLGDIGFLFSFAFPEYFSSDDFNKVYSKDGILLDSKEEYIIHEWFKDNIPKVDYTKKKFYNKDNNEYYNPDWIVNNNIIIEYFGLYSETQENTPKYIIDYQNKMERKIKFYSLLKDYIFIALYPIDLENNMQGVKEKLNKYIN